MERAFEIKSFRPDISEGGLELKCFVIVSVTKYICVFAAAFVKLTPEPTDSQHSKLVRTEYVIWTLPFLTDVFSAFVHSANNCNAYFSNRRYRLLSRSFPVFPEFRTHSRAALQLQSAQVPKTLLVASKEMKPAVNAHKTTRMVMSRDQNAGKISQHKDDMIYL